jgi:ABC-2 type transport system permease protein
MAPTEGDRVNVAAKYGRLVLSLSRYTLARELSLRGNFLVKVSVEVIWLGIMVAFYATVFTKTNAIAGWSQNEYLFFVGSFFALNGLIETVFLENCNEFAELVRTGDLDFLLLKPVDEQFLISCRRIDWAVAMNIPMGFIVMAIALARMDWHFDPARVAAFALTFACGAALAYSFMLALTATSVWLVRNQSLMEMWWLFSSLARYPKEIFAGSRAFEPIGFLFTFILPILLVANVPADAMVRTLSPGMIGYTIGATVILLVVSRWFFRRALRSYRSASS